MVGDPKKFYLVDDDSDIVELITTLLEAGGHTVRSNLRGVFAIPEIVDFRPDCVLIDLMMAELDGIQLYRELSHRAELTGTDFIMVSAQSADYWKNQAQDAGIKGYLAKPINAATFLSEIEAIVGSGSN